MKREEFLKSFGIGVSGLVLPKTSFFSTREVKIYDNYVRGLQYYDFRKIKKSVKEGDDLILKRDVENVHDTFAIEIYHNENKLGYIAAFENIVLANIIDQQVPLTAKISKLDLEDIYNAVAIEIYAELVIPSDKLITMISAEQRADDSIDLYRGNHY
ncbi:MAG: HIRAN domain-containing protein [Flavobacteriales bacterium]